MALLDYLQQRRSEIEAQIKALKAELGEIRVATDALTSSDVVSVSTSGVTAFRTKQSAVREGTIKDWVLRALEDVPEGLETDDVTQRVQDIGGPEVPRNSMTPQLSRLKRDGLITQVGRNWQLVKKRMTPEEAFGEGPPQMSGQPPFRPALADAVQEPNYLEDEDPFSL